MTWRPRPLGQLEAAERTRRRFARRQRLRRWQVWRRVLVAVLVLVLIGTGVWLAYFSSVLAVAGVSVQGADQVSAAQVRQAAAVPADTPLLRVDLNSVRRRVEGLAPVRSARVTRQWPDEILVSVQERAAVAVVDLGGSWRGMDSEGVVFREYDQAPATLPRVRVVGDAGRDALREAAQVVSALPEDLASRVDHVDVQTVDQISLVLRDGRVVVWGSAEQSDDKASVLAALLKSREARRYDVSVPGQPVTSD
ncbi:FtsQ-type POTRA domain-containing protein [Nocardioides sp. 616]|uniref:cell division protein FtsQ/DivIB n=1 Tax=Nocardioides sp. 616 TaxID=2268090 RepID=UPI000CE39A0F|nr:FtsQ-type POTRA domain-containing protein [Nocardioides sp. 616]